jgi:hypothetical protein
MKTYDTFDLIHEYGTQVLTKCKSPCTLSFEWIKAWLTQRQQCVAVEGETSGKAHVK